MDASFFPCIRLSLFPVCLGLSVPDPTEPGGKLFVRDGPAGRKRCVSRGYSLPRVFCSSIRYDPAYWIIHRSRPHILLSQFLRAVRSRKSVCYPAWPRTARRSRFFRPFKFQCRIPPRTMRKISTSHSASARHSFSGGRTAPGAEVLGGGSLRKTVAKFRAFIPARNWNYQIPSSEFITQLNYRIQCNTISSDNIADLDSNWVTGRPASTGKFVGNPFEGGRFPLFGTVLEDRIRADPSSARSRVKWKWMTERYSIPRRKKKRHFCQWLMKEERKTRQERECVWVAICIYFARPESVGGNSEADAPGRAKWGRKKENPSRILPDEKDRKEDGEDYPFQTILSGTIKVKLNT